MADFTVRVELVGSPGVEVYQNLHAKMQTLGFLTTVNNAGTTYKLPHATYYGSSILTGVELSSKVADLVATQVWTKPLVFVSETTNWGLSWR
jgi:hypothetical protein